jgi:hypothetical protein
MLTADVAFEGWTTQSWCRFLAMWQGDGRQGPKGGLVLVHDGTVVEKLIHTRRGRLAPGMPFSGDVAALAREHGASWVLATHRGGLDELMERFGARLRREDNLTAQGLLLLSIVRELINEGAILPWPQPLSGVPLPTAPMVARTTDLLCADGCALGIGLFDEGKLHTLAVLRRRGAGFDLVGGPEPLYAHMGLLSGDWRRDYRFVAEAIEAAYAPLSLGCFAELGVFRELLRDPTPGAWSRAVAVRDVVLSPVPIAIGVALGVDGARVAADTVQRAFARLDAFGMVVPVLEMAKKWVVPAAGEGKVTRSLGFNPLEVLRSLLARAD